MVTRTAGLFFLLSMLEAQAAMTTGALQMPSWFVENRGQLDPSVRYIGVGPGFGAWFQDDGVILQRANASVRLSFLRGLVQAKVQIEAELPTGAQANYLLG